MPMFTREEVHKAIKQMHPLKAPRPNGLPVLFYQQFWHVAGDEVTYFVLEILNNGADIQDLNHTFICLIPKVKKLKHLGQFLYVVLFLKLLPK